MKILDATGAVEAVSQSKSQQRRRALQAVYLVMAAFYLWTATSGGVRLNFGAPQRDAYNLLTNGFLHGQLSILARPSAALLHLKDPYDPKLNAILQGPHHDLALYHGHFYLTWGPTPVLTLFMPWRLLHIGGIPINFADWLYCIVGLGFALTLLKVLVERFIPAVSTAAFTLGAIAIACGSILPFLLRDPQVYEVNIASSYCFGIAGCYLLATGFLLGEVRMRRLFVASLCFGLAAGSHQDTVLLAILPLGVAISLIGRIAPSERRARLRVAAIVLGPLAICIALLLIYNVARFGSPLQFGAGYVLAGYNPRTTPLYDFRYVAPSLYYYLLSPARLTVSFPYLVLGPPPVVGLGAPKSYTPEIMGGVFAIMPITLALVPGYRYCRRRLIEPQLARAMVLLVISGLTIAGALALGLPGGSYRYEADFFTLFLIPALLCWFMLTMSATRWVRRSAKVLGTIAIFFGAAVGLAASTLGYYPDYPNNYKSLEQSDPVTYHRLTNVLRPIPALIVRLVGHPVVTNITSPTGVAQSAGYFDVGVPTTNFFYLSPKPSVITVDSPDNEVADLVAGVNLRPGFDPISQVIVTVHSSSITQEFAVGPPFVLKVAVVLHTGTNTLTMSARSTRDPGRREQHPTTQIAAVVDLRVERVPSP
jgi:hypothetical protein